jgi:hypothetical protein
MTITLDYTGLEFDDDDAVLRAEETDFEYDLLFAELTFRVDAADFTLAESVPLLDAATRLRTIAYLLADGGASSYESPASSEKLTFARSGDQVTISANYTDATATVGLAELQAATAAFHARVTRDLLARYPGLDETSGASPYFAPPPATGPA